MGLFSFNLNGIGPGGPTVPEPKSGFGRFFYILGRDSLSLMASGLLATVCAFPYMLGMYISVEGDGLLPMLVTCPLFGPIALMGIVGMSDTILRCLRNEAGFWWMRYRAAWKRNWRACIAPGVFGGFLFGFQYFMLTHSRGPYTDVFILIAMILGIVFAASVALWMVPQMALMELPLKNLLFNSILMAIRHPVKTFIAVVVTIGYWLFMLVFFPLTVVPYLLLTFWFPMLIAHMIIYKLIDTEFDIEKAIEELHGVPAPVSAPEDELPEDYGKDYLAGTYGDDREDKGE